MTHFFRTGSFGNGTNVSGYSDVDYFAVIPRANLNANSAQTLSDLAETLRQRFPNTGVRVNTPAVKVPFGINGSETTEVVPAYLTDPTMLGFRGFRIPDGNGGWIFSAPESNDAYVQISDDRLANQVKPLIRLVKAWKFWRNLPIKSFYLEMWIAHYAMSEGAIYFPIDLRNIFSRLYQSRLPVIVDPRFPDEAKFLQPVSTPVQHAEALKAIGDAMQWATTAVTNYETHYRKTAFQEWDRIFSGKFPPYV